MIRGKHTRENADMSDYEYYYRSGAHKMALWRRAVYGCGFHLFLEMLPISDYGGCRVPMKHSWAYYIGRATHDWKRAGLMLDKAYSVVAAELRSDFGIARSRLRKLTLVLISEPPGLVAIARHLKLHRWYAIAEGQTCKYFWQERAVFLAGSPQSRVVRYNLLCSLIWALCHQHFGATWVCTWAMDGYTAFAGNRAYWPPGTVDRDALAHLIGAARAQKTRSLRELVGVTDAIDEERLSERAYNEQVRHFVHYLHSQAQELPAAWDVVRAHIARDIWSASAVAARLEDAFGVTMDEIERRFLEWCKCRLASAPDVDDARNAGE